MRGGLLLILCAAAGCGDDLDPLPPDLEPGVNDPEAVTVMTYNVEQQGEGPRGATIAAHIASRAPDFAGLQEMSQPDALLAQMPARYLLTEPPHAGIALLYDGDAWRVTEQGALELGNNDDGWGWRKAVWARFAPADDLAAPGSLTVYSTHWCMPRRSPDDACDEERQVEYAQLMIDHIQGATIDGTPALVAGDFNVWDGFEDGMPMRLLREAGLVDVFRQLHPDDPGWTIPNDPAEHPNARIDYILSTAPVDVLDSWVDRDAVPDGEGSDHFAVLASLLPG